MDHIRIIKNGDMTTEERKEYNREYARQYRAAGFGKETDRRYRLKHSAKIQEKARERMRLKRMLAKQTPCREGSVSGNSHS